MGEHGILESPVWSVNTNGLSAGLQIYEWVKIQYQLMKKISCSYLSKYDAAYEITAKSSDLLWCTVVT